MQRHNLPPNMRYSKTEVFFDELCAALAAPFKLFGYIIAELPNVIWRKEKRDRKYAVRPAPTQSPLRSEQLPPPSKVSAKPNVEEW